MLNYNVAIKQENGENSLSIMTKYSPLIVLSEGFLYTQKSNMVNIF